jgi:hypothetical protein
MRAEMEWWRESGILLCTVLCGALPAAGAALAGMRFQGDFERFSERSHKTQVALQRTEKAFDTFIERCGEGPAQLSEQPPLFETLATLITELERELLSDLDDWRHGCAREPFR